MSRDIKEILNLAGYDLLDEYVKEKNKRVIIKNSFGYLCDGELYGVIKARENVRFFDKRNTFTLKNIALWLKLNLSEFELCQDNSYIGATEKLKLFHGIESCGEYFYMTWQHISRGTGCPICRGLQVGKFNNLGYCSPHLIKEWHSENEINIERVSSNSGRHAYWICKDCGYGKNKEWYSRITDRVNKKSGCPACSGAVVSDKNRLSIIFPEIAYEWDNDKNEDTPNDVSFGSQKNRYWICSKCEDSYSSSIKDRTSGVGCPKCNIYRGEKKIKNWIEGNESKLNKVGFVEYVFQKRIDGCKNKNPLPFDFGLKLSDNSWCLIEYHGIQHYEPIKFFGGNKKLKKQKQMDKIKERYCFDKKIPLLVIPYWEFDNIEYILSNYFSIQ